MGGKANKFINWSSLKTLYYFSKNTYLLFFWISVWLQYSSDAKRTQVHDLDLQVSSKSECYKVKPIPTQLYIYIYISNPSYKTEKVNFLVHDLDLYVTSWGELNKTFNQIYHQAKYK